MRQVDFFEKEITMYNIALTDSQIQQYLTYYEMLVETNRVMNLTAITDFHDVMIRHFADSLTITKTCDIEGISRVIDIGTGAGFPGLPLKIAFPHLKVTLLDSLNKRITFLDKVIRELKLDCVETLHGRAEDFAHDEKYREQYDLAVSRAVAPLSCLAEYCLPYVRPEGYFVSYKSGTYEQELQSADHAISELGGELQDVTTFELSDAGRSLIKIGKKKKTPVKYPRKAGIPAKKPL